MSAVGQLAMNSLAEKVLDEAKGPATVSDEILALFTPPKGYAEENVSLLSTIKTIRTLAKECAVKLPNKEEDIPEQLTTQAAKIIPLVQAINGMLGSVWPQLEQTIRNQTREISSHSNQAAQLYETIKGKICSASETAEGSQTVKAALKILKDNCKKGEVAWPRVQQDFVQDISRVISDLKDPFCTCHSSLAAKITEINEERTRLQKELDDLEKEKKEIEGKNEKTEAASLAATAGGKSTLGAIAGKVMNSAAALKKLTDQDKRRAEVKGKIDADHKKLAELNQTLAPLKQVFAYVEEKMALLASPDTTSLSKAKNDFTTFWNQAFEKHTQLEVLVEKVGDVTKLRWDGFETGVSDAISQWKNIEENMKKGMDL